LPGRLVLMILCDAQYGAGLGLGGLRKSALLSFRVIRGLAYYGVACAGSIRVDIRGPEVF